MSPEARSQFYTGLVADLYDPLAAARSRADDYIPFLTRSGTPALELACGSGMPLVELVERGYEVEGLDASRDMLERCRARASERGVSVTVHLAEMQSFSLPRRYRSIFIAGGSFTLLTTDDDAARALACMHAHLDSGGSVLIPLDRDDVEQSRAVVGRARETTTESGQRLRVTLVAVDASADTRNVRHRLRYERISETGESESLERDWERRAWSQQQFRDLLLAAGFDKVTLLSQSGGRAEPDASQFVALARRGALSRTVQRPDAG